MFIASPLDPTFNPELPGQAQDQRKDSVRVCKDCGRDYDIDELFVSQRQYFDHPYDYATGSGWYCLDCWLGVGPNDIAKMDC